MKRAFTLIELVFVVVITGILAFVLIPKSSDTKLLQATNQIISHIRYTQSLAINGDQFDPNDKNWYKKMWRISFSNINNKKDDKYNGWNYVVWRDSQGNSTANPNSPKEIAPDPAAPGKLLYANVSGGHRWVSDSTRNPKLNLTNTYNIKDIKFANFKKKNSKTLIFDELGRVYSPKIENSYDNKHDQIATITLTHKNGQSLSIMIEQETGYVCIAKKEKDLITCDENYNL